jgi:hypothetical protein
MHLLGTWRRFHGYQVIAEARSSGETGMWTIGRDPLAPMF